MKRLYIFPVFLLIAGWVSAQTVNDIARYSEATNFGSARAAAMGGAFGALGGDLSSLTVNPAGVGVFRKSEISITPYLNVSKTNSDNRSINQSSFQLGTLGAVISFYSPNFNWRGFNFAINYTNLNNFNRKTDQYIYNSPTSFSQVWANEANVALSGNSYIPTISELAYSVGVLDYELYVVEQDTFGQYEPSLYPGEEINQHKYIKEDGYQGEYDISFGTNYKDKLYLGMTIGIQTIRYKYRSVFTGKGDEANRFGLDQYSYGQYLKTEGVGTNFKFGVIYRPIPEVRLGAAIHTPTFYSMTDHYTEDMRSQFYLPDADGNTSYYNYVEPYSYDYDMRTPWRAVLSVATVLKQKIIVSMDYEYVNYSSGKFSDGEDGYDFYAPNGSGANDNIKALLTKAHNVRLGAEYRFNSIFSWRGGYALWSSPYKHNHALKTQSVSTGFGINLGNFYCDAAYVYKFSKDTTYFYEYIDPDYPEYDFTAEPIKNKYMSHQGRITLGVRF